MLLALNALLLNVKMPLCFVAQMIIHNKHQSVIRWQRWRFRGSACHKTLRQRQSPYLCRPHNDESEMRYTPSIIVVSFLQLRINNSLKRSLFTCCKTFRDIIYIRTQVIENIVFVYQTNQLIILTVKFKFKVKIYLYLINRSYFVS